MRQKRIEPVVYDGGLDVVTPPIEVPAGKIIDAKNYECATSGGYQMLAGYERVDGRVSATRGDWHALAVDSSAGIAPTDSVTGGTSGATGEVLLVSEGVIYVVAVVGAFTNGETLSVAAVAPTMTAPPLINGTFDDNIAFKDVRYAKEIYYRDFIEAVPGVGPIRGIHRHLGKLYAWRDFDGSECRLYEATTAGWSLVPFGHIVFFNNRTNQIGDPGTELNDGNGNTATAIGVVWTTVAETDGYIVVLGYTAGFQVGDTIKQATVALSTITEAATPVVQAAAGRYEMLSHNFAGNAATYNVWGCDGVNPAFSLDVTNNWFLPIYTDQANRAIDNPKFIATYTNHLFLGFERGIIRNSEPGDPLLWDAAAGSIEIGIGAPVTGFDATPASLTVATTRITYALTGAVKEAFVLDVASARTGARPYTMQHIGTTYMLDDRGIIELSRVQAFGNFENATVSRQIKPIITELLSSVIASTIVRVKNIYRIFTADGRGLSMTLMDSNVVSFSIIDLDRPVACAANAEDELGDERVYFGSDDGFVYELERGRSFDGVARESWIQPTHHFIRSPTVVKRFYRMYIDATVEGSAEVFVYAEYSLGTADKLPTREVLAQFTGQRSTWDRGLWDVAVFDARRTSDIYVDLVGSGDAISLIYYSNSAVDDIVALKNVIYHYKTRRAMRGSR